MKTEIFVENEKEIEATISIRMSLNDWEDLKRQLTTSYPSWKLTEAINDLLRRFRGRITNNTTEE